MALDRSEDHRKGNPNWVRKNGQKNPKNTGRPEGGRSKANSSTKRTLNRLDRHPVEELIKIADLALEAKDYVFAREIWERIHDESTAHNTEEINEQKRAEKALVKELEDVPEKPTEDKASEKPNRVEVPSTDRALTTALEAEQMGPDKILPL